MAMAVVIFSVLMFMTMFMQGNENPRREHKK